MEFFLFLYIYFIHCSISVKQTNSIKFFENAEHKGSLCIKILTVLCAAQIGIIYTTHFCLAIYNVLIGNDEPETYNLPYTISLPFERTTYIGYAAAFILNMSITVLYAINMVAVMGFFYSACWYIEACTICFHEKISTIDQTLISNKMENEFRKAVEFHIKIIECVKKN